MKNISAYQKDLAYIHDVGFGFLAKGAATHTIKHLQKSKNNTVVDLGCGSGIFAEKLVEKGYKIVGIDLSQDMIRLATKRVPNANFIHQSLFDAKIPTCAAVTAIGECMNYLFDATHSTERLNEVFQKIFESLEPGGFFLFDVAVPGRGSKEWSKGFSEGNDWAIFFSAKEEKRSRLLVRRMTCFRKIKNTYRRSYEEHRLQLFPAKNIRKMLKKNGFTNIKILKNYGNQSLFDGLVGFIAWKQK
jgi:SAM-dependent methyltransferase